MKFARMFLFLLFIVAMVACGKPDKPSAGKLPDDGTAVDLPENASVTDLSEDATADKG